MNHDRCYNSNVAGHVSLNCPQPQRQRRCVSCKKVGQHHATCDQLKPMAPLAKAIPRFAFFLAQETNVVINQGDEMMELNTTENVLLGAIGVSIQRIDNKLRFYGNPAGLHLSLLWRDRQIDIVWSTLSVMIERRFVFEQLRFSELLCQLPPVTQPHYKIYIMQKMPVKARYMCDGQRFIILNRPDKGIAIIRHAIRLMLPALPPPEAAEPLEPPQLIDFTEPTPSVPVVVDFCPFDGNDSDVEELVVERETVVVSDDATNGEEAAMEPEPSTSGASTKAN